MIGLLSAVVLAAAPPNALVIDAGGVVGSAAAGDVVLPVELELPLWKRLRFLARVQLSGGYGASAGLYAAGLRAGVRWYPFSDAPSEGFWLALHGGGDAIVETHAPGGFGGRLSAGVGLGWGFVFAERVVVSPGIEVSPIGFGFPQRLLSLRLGVGAAF